MSEGCFLDLAMSGKALLEEIDDYVDAWHEQPQGTLHSYLGMTQSEYSLWAVEPDMLPHIIRARVNDLPLNQVANDNYGAYAIAARSGSSLKLRRLKQWLEKEGLVD